ncbi:MAG: GatB/YqeY domain-containing protein [Crocinitomicaceae bacterium]|nr:GatB/YqeY domain-containing protein [Crocinitomicaceae bacterium]MBK8926198.1 GatB/YqeY domain-containing protein [Crocinitomicaceae bacterium]
MSLTERINNDIKEAMKAREKEKLEALRDIKSKLLLEATSGSGTVTEESENKIVLKLHKQRLETYEIYTQQGRQDLADAEMFQAKIIEAYLPNMMSEEEVRKVVREKIAAVGASGPQDMGKVMGPVMGQLNGKADGKVISEIVKQELSSK